MSTLSLTRGSQSRAHSIIQAPKLCVLHLAPLQLDKSQGFHDDSLFKFSGSTVEILIKLEGKRIATTLK